MVSPSLSRARERHEFPISLARLRAGSPVAFSRQHFLHSSPVPSDLRIRVTGR